MANLQVLHDSAGKITSLGEVEARKAGALHASLVPGAGETFLEVEKTGELSGKKLDELYQNFRVDVKSKKLVRI
jgi:hypothetical protein